MKYISRLFYIFNQSATFRRHLHFSHYRFEVLLDKLLLKTDWYMGLWLSWCWINRTAIKFLRLSKFSYWSTVSLISVDQFSSVSRHTTSIGFDDSSWCNIYGNWIQLSHKFIQKTMASWIHNLYFVIKILIFHYQFSSQITDATPAHILPSAVLTTIDTQFPWNILKLLLTSSTFSVTRRWFPICNNYLAIY